MSSPIKLRAPVLASTASSSSAAPDFQNPPTSWLRGSWYVTHSTLPMWKSKRNVRITYTEVPGSEGPKLDDLVTYQALSSDKVKSIKGVDSPTRPGAWDWRGVGWLTMITSHWQLLGYGGAETDGDAAERWGVTFFEKTHFTPAGIDIYSRQKEGLSSATLESIRQALKEVDSDVIKNLATELFEVKVDC